MSPRMCRLCGVVEDHFHMLNAESECWAGVHCKIRAFEQQVETLKARAERAEAELRRITPYANHTQFCAISTYDGPRKYVACDCGYQLAEGGTP